MIVADVSIIPIGVGESVSKFVKKAVEEIKRSGLKVEVTAMSTIVEAGKVEDIFSAIQRAREAVFEMGAKRVYTIIRLDERRDKELTIAGKLSKISQSA
ncbi:MAG: MTH1187 family thiamine-binding protein [Archaeoglobaceae archaeon]|nr:MTH1187 family thiamine-binding protein [Archaeoglobaceae archaeon]